jgi:hypothetical protein
MLGLRSYVEMAETEELALLSLAEENGRYDVAI